MYILKLPLKFIGLWVLNIALLLALTYGTGLREIMMNFQIKNTAYLYLGIGALLALLEQELWDRLKQNRSPEELGGNVMKKHLTRYLALVLVFSLFGCSETENVKYYETRSYSESSTGDINRRENTYDENWNLLLQYRTLNDKFASQVEYEYSEDYRILTTKTTSAIYEPETSRIISDASKLCSVTFSTKVCPWV
jgi:hypothetical protein